MSVYDRDRERGGRKGKGEGGGRERERGGRGGAGEEEGRGERGRRGGGEREEGEREQARRDPPLTWPVQKRAGLKFIVGKMREDVRGAGTCRYSQVTPTSPR